VKVNFAEAATPDIELIARLRRREIAAWESVYDRYAGHMLRLALRLVGQPPVAEDIVREVFMELWTRPNLFQGLAVSVALAEAVCNRGVAHLRRQSDQRLPMWQAFAQLPDDQQRVILLSFAGFNWHEIAAQLHCPESKIAALARTALRTLHRASSTQMLK
jgi:DNA-directed RNA polymerase specialized sigma24 family protein